MSDQNKPEDTMASKGGRASAAKLTAAERKERAKKAAESRWAADLPLATHGTPDRPLRLGGHEIPCYVLGDGRRVLAQRGVIQALGMAPGGSSHGRDRLAKILGQNRLKDHVPKSLSSGTLSPIEFRTQDNRRVLGYEATILPDICDAILSARKAGHLHARQEAMAEQCEILLRGFARVGIIALVDEATGFQYDRRRDELRQILEQYVSKELARWERAFEADFYKHIYRLKGWKMDPNTSKRTHQVARLTVDLVYDRIHPDLLKELKHTREEKGKPTQKLHQWLTTFPGGGHPRLKQHNEGITALLSVAKTWGQFYEWMESRYPKLNQTMRIPFLDDPEDDLPPPIPLPSSTSQSPPSEQSPPAAQG